MSLADRIAEKAGFGANKIPIDNHSIAEVLSGQDAIPQHSRVGSDYIHLSSLLNLCIRREYLARTFDPAVESPTSAQRIMWKIGRALESHVRESYLRSEYGKAMYGIWRCACGHTQYTGRMQSNTKCERCYKGVDNYHEYTVRDDTLKIIGNPDLLLMGKDNALTVVEIKSMTKTSFDPLGSALPDHVLQASGYAYLLHRAGFKVRDAVKVFYVRKEYQPFCRVYKEYDVRWKDQKQILDSAFDQVASLREAEKGEEIPKRLNACVSLHDRIPKKCPLGSQCFMVGE